MTGRTSIPVLVIALGGAWGCQSTPRDSAERPVVRGTAPAGQRADLPPAVPAASVPALGPLGARTLAYLVPRNLEYLSPKGKAMVVRRGPPPDCLCAGRTWVVKTYEVDGPIEVAAAAVDAGAVKPVRERTFIVLPGGGGGIGLAEQIDREEGVEVVFEPPLLVMPDGLPLSSVGNAQMAQELTMTVHPLGNRQKVKASGRARNVVRYLADEALTTPAGTFTARRLQSVLTADLPPARIANTTQQWFVDNVGLVRKRDQERTTVFGVPTRNNTSDWTLQAYRAQ